jgi:heme exporter protein C
MVLTYAAYLMLRNAIENGETRRRFAAVYGIFAFTTVLITLLITRIRPDTIHPVVIGPSPQNAEGGFEFTARIGAVVGFNSFVWTVFIPGVLMAWRMRVQDAADRVEALRTTLAERR